MCHNGGSQQSGPCGLGTSHSHHNDPSLGNCHATSRLTVDGISEVIPCPDRACPLPDWVGVDADPNTCNAWQIRMHEDGWADATMRVEDSDGTVLIDGLTYSGGLVESGVAETCLGPSRCYTITVSGPSTAQWSVHDAHGVVVAQGSAPYSEEICHCGHTGGDECLDCTGVVAPDGGTIGTCAEDGTLAHDTLCRATCSRTARRCR